MSLDTRLWDEQEEPMIRYLLGRMPAAERETIDDRLLEDQEFLERLLAAGDDLIHAYLKGELSDDDKKRFETHFLSSPLRRQRFELVRGLVKVVAETPSRPARRYAPAQLAAAAAVLIVAGVIGARFFTPTLPPPHAGGVVTPGTPSPRATLAPRPAEAVHAMRLPSRVTEPVTIPVSAETRTVRLEVPTEGKRDPTFDAALRDAAGRIVWEQTGLVPAGAGLALVVMIPADILAGDDYTLHVEGEPLRDAPQRPRLSLKYALRVTRER